MPRIAPHAAPWEGAPAARGAPRSPATLARPSEEMARACDFERSLLPERPKVGRPAVRLTREGGGSVPSSPAGSFFADGIVSCTSVFLSVQLDAHVRGVRE